MRSQALRSQHVLETLDLKKDQWNHELGETLPPPSRAAPFSLLLLSLSVYRRIHFLSVGVAGRLERRRRSPVRYRSRPGRRTTFDMVDW